MVVMTTRVFDVEGYFLLARHFFRVAEHLSAGTHFVAGFVDRVLMLLNNISYAFKI